MSKKVNVSYVTNGYGARVKKQCASCQYRNVENDGTRFCPLLGMKVRQKFGCKRWKMDRSCEVASMRMGKVKRKEYLVFALAVRREEWEDIRNGIITEQDCLPVDEIRRMFEESFGSIYGIR